MAPVTLILSGRVGARIGILIGIGTAFIAPGYSNINFYGAIAAFAAGH
jgi:hypothetical protein